LWGGKDPEGMWEGSRERAAAAKNRYSTQGGGLYRELIKKDGIKIPLSGEENKKEGRM